MSEYRRTSHHLQQEYPDLRKRYWGQHFWAIGYGVWSTGLITDEMFKSILSIIEIIQIQRTPIGY